MKKSVLTFAILVSGLFITSLLFTGCSGKKEQTDKQVQSDSTMQGDMKMDSTQMVYACPMHPEVTGKEGDTCSKCGMALAAVKTTDTTAHNDH